ncbi:uncharacterized protein LOC116919830 [Daphnia magna]|uniref:uncharacterized protein LOC116919830 n=1 Tax=Daphnia magna TaxID=35525 RepID=UPI001E1BD3A4|nr:uncharacterized protein LOC116919830 [Daphnia magna]
MTEILEREDFYYSSDSDHHDEENAMSSLNDLESASDFSDHSFIKEMDLIASGSCNKETIEGLKEPGFKTPISSAPSPTAPRKTKGKKASLESEAAKEIGQLMKTIGQVLESKPEIKKPNPLERILNDIEEVVRGEEALRSAMAKTWDCVWLRLMTKRHAITSAMK